MGITQCSGSARNPHAMTHPASSQQRWCTTTQNGSMIVFFMYICPMEPRVVLFVGIHCLMAPICQQTVECLSFQTDIPCQRETSGWNLLSGIRILLGDHAIFFPVMCRNGRLGCPTLFPQLRGAKLSATKDTRKIPPKNSLCVACDHPIGVSGREFKNKNGTLLFHSIHFDEMEVFTCIDVRQTAAPPGIPF